MVVDLRGAGVHDDADLLAGADDRRRGDRVRRIDPAGERVDVSGSGAPARRSESAPDRVLGSSRLMIFDLVGLNLSALSLRYCSTPRSICWPSSAPMPVNAQPGDLDLLRVSQCGGQRKRCRRHENAFSSSNSLPDWFEPASPSALVSARILGRKPEPSQASGTPQARPFSAFCWEKWHYHLLSRATVRAAMGPIPPVSCLAAAQGGLRRAGLTRGLLLDH